MRRRYIRRILIMSFKATFYKFPKRDNSTAQPPITADKVEYDIVMKDSGSILAPAVTLQMSFSTSPDQYNYCYIAAFNRYYHVKDWIYDGRLWTAQLSVDVLASYKYWIGISSEYVVRSASQSNGRITDNLYPVTGTYSVAWSTVTNPNELNILTGMAGGSFVIGIMNGDDNAIGGISYYVMSLSQMQALRKFLLGNTNAGTSDLLNIITNDITDVSDGVVKALFNPFQYIASCIWFPFDLTSENWTSVTNLQFGYWQLTNIGAKRIPAASIVHLFTGTVSPSAHPQAATRGSYLNCAPYTDNVLYIPPFGSIPLDGVLIQDISSIGLYWWVDLSNGTCTLDIKGTGPNSSLVQVVAPQTAQVGVPVTLSAIGTNYNNNMLTAVSLGADILTGLLEGNGQGTNKTGNNYFTFDSTNKALGVMQAKALINGTEKPEAAGASIQKAAVDAISGVGNVAKAIMTSVQTRGNSGSFAELASNTSGLFQVFYHVADDDNTHRGRPLCQTVTINTLSGYIQVADPDFAGSNCTAEERAQIKNYMATGFYYE